MGRRASSWILAITLLLLAARDLDAGAAEGELRDEGFTAVELRPDEGAEGGYSFTARREGKACTGLVTVRWTLRRRVASIVSQCEAGPDAGH